MNKLDSLDRLGPIADEMLAGLHADQRMKMRIRAAAEGHKRVRRSGVQRALVPALCCAALAFACVGALNLRGVNPQMETAQIQTIAAGEDAAAMKMSRTTVADLGDNAQVTMASAGGESLFAEAAGDIPLVALRGAVYRMLSVPQTLSGALCGEAIGTVAHVTQEPSLASAEELGAGLSNVAQAGTAIYSVNGLADTTAVAAEVDGCMRLFQRVSYAGKGPGAHTLEDTLGVRGQVKSLELSGVGVLEGERADEVAAVLLDCAALKAADMSAQKQMLTLTLDNGLRLQLGVSGDTLTGCGGWSCPEFFEAFEAAL